MATRVTARPKALSAPFNLASSTQKLAKLLRTYDEVE
jgi:hypothetical protein